MKTLSDKAKRYIHLSTFQRLTPILFIIGGVASISLTVHIEDSQFFWVVIFGLPLLISFLVSSRKIRQVNNAYRYMIDRAICFLRRADYYNSGVFGAIAIDVANGEIATISANRKFKFTNPFVFKAGDITGFKTQFEACLIIYLDRIDKTQVIIQMELDEAETWLRVIERFLNGNLEDKPKPMLLPKNV